MSELLHSPDAELAALKARVARLERLEEQGYVVVARTEVIRNRARSYYAITDAGAEYLSRSLMEYREMHRAFMSIMGGKCGDEED